MRQRRFLTPAQQRATNVKKNFGKDNYRPRHNVWYAKWRRLGSRIVPQGCLDCYRENPPSGTP